MGFPAYMLKVNLAIIVVWVLYRIAFRQLSFFRWNRFYLLGSVVLSFILPLIRLPRGSRMTVTGLSGIDWEYVDHLVQLPAPFLPEVTGISIHSVFLEIYLGGALFLLVVNAWRFLKIWSQTRHARPVNFAGTKVYIQVKRNGSFTFFRKVYLDLHSWDRRLQYVFRHEMAHASQLHFVDLIIMVFAGVFLWFNPFVFLLLRSIRENHEYLADEEARSEPGALSAYLACLRDETIRLNSPAVASFFKGSSIKKRIIMLTNHHKNPNMRWRYLSILPLLALMLLAFQAPVERAIPELISNKLSDEIPSLFPLPENYKEEISWGFHEKAVHPFTKKQSVHQGLDIPAPRGTAVFAAAGGRVTQAELLDGWGNLLVIKHSEGYSTFYAHLQEFKVKEGDIVEKGQKIALVGSTGLSTGPHLHYEVRNEGANMNPEDYY